MSAWHYMPEVGEIVQLHYVGGSSYARVVQVNLPGDKWHTEGFRCIEETGTVRRVSAATWSTANPWCSPCQGPKSPRALPVPEMVKAPLELAALDFLRDAAAFGDPGTSVVRATVLRWRAQ